MTPERIEEAKRVAEALTIPLAGKYISTDDIKKGGQIITELLESKDIKRPWINMNVKHILLGGIACIMLGFGMGKLFTWESTMIDCKVLGAFRIGNTAFHCKIAP